MNIVIASSINSLKKSQSLLLLLNNDDLCNSSVSPYYSCIGSHIRHILDFYDCILDGIDAGNINLTNRKRDEKMHNDCNYASINVERVITRLKSLDDNRLDDHFLVEDDLGLGMVSITYTLGAILAQANSHAIHHYAIISYILDRLGIKINDSSFGYNPTTPKPTAKLN